MRKNTPDTIRIRKKKVIESHIELNRSDALKYWMTIFAQTSQIVLVFVAVFGYFYTVRPIHQKEMLEEKLTVLEAEIADARLLMPELIGEKDSLSKQIHLINKELRNISSKKEEIENSIQYMEYKYHLPDGTPAKTTAEVNKALDYKIKNTKKQRKKDYLNGFNLDHRWFIKDKDGKPYPFLQSYNIVDSKSEYFPFYKNEIDVWNSSLGVEYFLRQVALKELEKYHKEHINRYINPPKSWVNQYSAWRATLKDRINTSQIEWVAPYNPDSLVNEYRQKRKIILEKEISELEKVEEESGDWESTWFSAEKEILRHNYKVGKQNAKINKYNASSKIERV